MKKNKREGIIKDVALVASTAMGIGGVISGSAYVQAVAYFPAWIEKVILGQYGEKEDIQIELLRDLKVAIKDTCVQVRNILDHKNTVLADFFYAVSMGIESDAYTGIDTNEIDTWVHENMKKEKRWGYIDITEKEEEFIAKLFFDEFNKQLVNYDRLCNFLIINNVIRIGKQADKIEIQVKEIQNLNEKKQNNSRHTYEEIYKDAIHKSHVYNIVPDKLFQRDNELKALEEICKNELGYFSVEAEAYTGKSALLSWFFQHPPKDIWIVGYFLIRRIGKASSEQFEKAIKLQLINIILLSSIEKQYNKLEEKTIVQLLEEATEVAQNFEKKLVLVVDGLDEEVKTNYGKQCVLDLLPRENIFNLIIILSCRPNPDVFDNLESDHAAKKRKIYNLSQSQYVKDIQIKAQAELQELYEDEKFKKIIALLAVSRGALTISDLYMLTNEIYWIDIKNILSGFKGRIFMTITPESGVTMMEGKEKGYTFAHDTLQEQALNDLVGSNANLYVEMLNRWCENYQEQKWPLETPIYLITDYLRLLAYNAQWNSLADILINYNFVSLVSKKNVSCFLYFNLIKETIAGLSAVKNVDFVRIGLLSETREKLALRDDNIPVELPILFAKLGYYDDAVKMTETMADQDRLLSLSQIAVILARKGEVRYAVSMAQEVINSIPFEMYPYQRSSMHEYDYTLYLSNCAEAFVISGCGNKAEEFFNCLLSSLDLDERIRLGKGEMIFFHSLQEIVFATAKAGGIEVALREAEKLSFDWQTKSFTLVSLGVLQALQGDFEGAIKSAENAYLTNYYNDGRCNREGRHGNEHVILECAKILKIIEKRSQINGTSEEGRSCRLKIVFPTDGQIKYLSFEDLLDESNVQDYWNQFIGKMYVEIAEEFLNLGYQDVALELVKIAHVFLKKHRMEYKYAKPEYTDIELVQIAKIETVCLNAKQALVSVQEIHNINKIIEAYIIIAREAYKKGDMDEAENVLFMAKQKMKEVQEENTILKVVLASSFIDGTEVAVAMSPKSSTVKEYVSLLCKIAEERIANKDVNGAEQIAKEALSKLTLSDYNLVSLDEYHLKEHVFNPIDISKNLFDIGEYEFALKVAAISGKSKWFAKLLMKTALEILSSNKSRALKLFEMALDIIKTYKLKIDVNKKENSKWSDCAYEKDEPTIMDFVIMSRELIWLGDKDSARSILPPYPEFSEMLWQSTNLYAYEGLYIYFMLGDKEEIKKDLMAVCDAMRLKFAKAWLAVAKDDFCEIDFSDINFFFSRDENAHTLSISYESNNSDGLMVRIYDADIPIDFYESLEKLTELHEKGSITELHKLIQKLSAPYDGENHYGQQRKWSVRMILLIRKLHEIGILNQNKMIISDFKDFLFNMDSVRDNLICLWSDTLLYIDSPIEDIVENIKLTYCKKYNGEYYNPDRPNVARALTAVLKKYPSHSEAIRMIREVCHGYIENAYSYDYGAFIEAQQSLSVDLGMRTAFLDALQLKPWYDMIDLFAYLDLQALRKVIEISYGRIECHIREQESIEDSISLQLIMRNISVLTC